MLNTDLTDTHQVSQSNLIHLRHCWKEYLTHADTLSTTDQYRLSLTEMMYQYQLQGRTLYHLTVTYKPYLKLDGIRYITDKSYLSREYVESDVANFFKYFYLRDLLPLLMSTSNFHRPKYRHIQPITLVFTDEHESKSSATSKYDPDSNQFKIKEFAARLHHHVILAVHSDHVEQMNELIGTNTLAKYKLSHQVMTTHIRDCDAMCLLYASKLLRKYPDFLSFPDRVTKCAEH